MIGHMCLQVVALSCFVGCQGWHSLTQPVLSHRTELVQDRVPVTKVTSSLHLTGLAVGSSRASVTAEGPLNVYPWPTTKSSWPKLVGVRYDRIGAAEN